MSIESASASQPVVRENESASGRNAWSFMQGSSTGSKDGQFSSFWDDAIHGSQKLSNAEKAKIDSEESRRDDDSDESEKKAKEPLSSTPGFSNAKLNGFTRGVRSPGFGSVPRFGSTQRPEEPEASSPVIVEDSSKEKTPQTLERKESPSADHEITPKEKTEPVEAKRVTSEEEESSEEKSADSTGKKPSMSAAKVGENILLSADRKQVADSVKSVGIESAKNAGDMPTLATAPVKDAAPVVSGEVEVMAPAITPNGNAVRPEGSTVAGQNASAAGEQRANAQPASNPVGVAKPAQQADTQNSGGKQGSEATGQLASKGDAKVSAGEKTNQGEAIAKESSKKGEDQTLSFDPDKAKAAVSKGLKRSGASTQNSQGQATQNTSAETVASTSSKEAAPSELRSETSKAQDSSSENIEPAPKKAQTSRNGKAAAANAGKPELAGRAAELAKPSSNTVQMNASEASVNASSKTDAASFESRQSVAQSAVVRPTQTRPLAPIGNGMGNANTAIQGISGTSSAMSSNAVNETAGSQLGNRGFEQGSAKQDSSIATSKSASGAKGAKATGETSQAFDAPAANAASRKGQAAAKASMTSYASKSVEELKEVYKTLTNSVEKLLASKADNVSIRINFEQGGSLALRVKLDGGQVFTNMQTDLPGLESMIKANWSELSSEWNARGVKLNAPQFANQAEGESRNENFTTFDQKEGRQGQQSEASGQKGSRRGSSSANSSVSSQASNNANSSESEAQSDERSETGDNELKTYA